MLCFALLALTGCASSTSPTRHAVATHAPGDTDSELDQSEYDPIGLLIAQNLRQGTSNYPDIPAVNLSLVRETLNYLGIRYRAGGETPDKGFDCSGLILYAAAQSLGLKLPRSAAGMFAWGPAESVDRDELVAGDLVFFNTMGRRYSHVGVYLGGDRFVHSPSSGGVVRIDTMTQAYWQKRYNGAKRLDHNLLASARLTR